MQAAALEADVNTVEVAARCVIDRLDCGDQTWQSLVERGELRCGWKRLGSHTESCRPEVGRPGGLGSGCVDQYGVYAASGHRRHRVNGAAGLP